MAKYQFPVLAAFILAMPLFAQADVCPDGDPPEAAVRGYLQAMKDYQFEQAYDFVTDKMTDGKSREAWSELQTQWFIGGEVLIGKLDIRDAHASSAEDRGCKTSAIVPNVFRARDKFNNQGSTEFELYTVVEQDGAWRIDLQETLIDEPKIKTWFPNDEIPDYRQQL